MKLWQKLAISFLFVLFVFLVIGILISIDENFNNSRYVNKIAYGSDCNYTVPAGYRIVYSTDKKKYAVADLKFGDYYLYNGRVGITGMYSSIAEPSLFDDSCEAKAYLKAYINSIQPKMADYK